MKRYEKYKNTDLQWIKEIPYDWSLCRISAVFNERNEKVSDKDFMPLSVTKNGIVPQLEDAAKSDAHDNRKKICKGDFAINSRSDRKGSSGISSFEGSGSLINIVIEPVRIMGAYANYLLKSVDFQEEFYRNGTGIVADLWSTNYQKMKRIQIPIPPKSEQEKIAAFLDYKIGRIDKAIEIEEKKKEKFKTLKQSIISDAVTKGLNPDAPMKDSGVDWIGEIPEHWGVSKLKYFIKLSSGKNIVSEEIEENGPYPVYGGNGLRGYVNEYTNEGEYILIGRQGALAGNIHLVSEKFWATDHALVVYNNRNNTFYLYYLLIAMNLNQYAFYTAAQPGLSASAICDLYFPVINFEEQLLIVEYLDNKTTEIDAYITIIDEKIEKLKALKQSLISAVVTGQIDVRDFEIPEEAQ